MGKKAGKQVQSHNERSKTTSSISQPATLDMSSVLTRFSPSGRLFAQLSIAVDADTLRVYEVQSGQCVGRWASSSASERVSSLEWVELPSSSSSLTGGEEKPTRGKKRRKNAAAGAGAGAGGENNNGDASITKDGDSSVIIQDSAAAASTSAAAEEASSSVSTMEVIALGLKNASILILHPTQSTIIQVISHPSITSPPISLSYPPSSASQQPFLLWSCTANGQLSAWSLPRLSGTKGKLVAQYDTNCSSCSTVAVRYTSSSKPQPNGAANNENTSQSTNGTTVQVLLGQFSIKLFEMPLPSTKQSLSESFERPRIHLRSEASGHASEVSQIAWLNGEVTPSSTESSTPQVSFVSIAKGDRFVSLWSAPVAASAEGPTSGTLVATLGLDEEPRRIALSSNKSIICCISSDAARIISLDFANAEQQAAAQGASIKKSRKSVRSLRILSTLSSSSAAAPCTDAFLPVNPAGTICVAAGVVKPALDSVSYRDQTGAYIPALQLSTRSLGALNGANGHVGSEAPRAAYSEARQSTVLSAEAARDPSIASASAMAEVDPAAEPTIAERLNELEVRDSRQSSSQQQQGGGAVTSNHETSIKKRSRTSGRSNIANALSTTQSLVQALHSADVKLLETCLAEKNPKIIRATVRRVPGTLVLPLVEALVERLSRRRKGTGEGSGGVDATRGQVLIEWLRNVLIVHLGYLITIPSLVERLSALHATLESRMSFHSQLLALSGRLDLVVSQIDIRAHPLQDLVQAQKASTSSSSAPVKNMKPGSKAVKKYVEGEDESEDESSSDEDDEDDDDDEEDRIEAAEEGDDEDIEDLVMANGEVTADELDDDEDEDEDESSEEDELDEEEDEIPALRKSKKNAAKANKPKMNGFLDIEAEESENEGSDEEGNPIARRKTSGSAKLNGVINEDSLDEDEEDSDQYESDFINDDSEDEEESGEDDDEEDDDE